jgi:hypothetical protein
MGEAPRRSGEIATMIGGRAVSSRVERERRGGAWMSGQSFLARPAPSGLAEVVETVLGRGIVIDAYVRVSLLGIELLTIDARVVVASVDTYLRFAEATNRLDLVENGPPSLLDLAEEGYGRTVEQVASTVVEHKAEQVKDTVVGTAEGAVEHVVEKVADTASAAAESILPGRGHAEEDS